MQLSFITIRAVVCLCLCTYAYSCAIEEFEATPGNKKLVLSWNIDESNGACKPKYTVSCRPKDVSSDAEESVLFQKVSLTETRNMTVDELVNGVEYNCTISAHLLQLKNEDIVDRAWTVGTPGCAVDVNAADVFLGILQSSAEDQVEFKWHFAESVDLECLPDFEVHCASMDYDLSMGSSVRRASIASGSHSGMTKLPDLQSSQIYSCTLETKDTNGTYRVSSKPVYVGHPKVLKSKNCKHGNYGMVNSTTLFVREGCGGVFLLPGGAGLMCKSTEGSYVECHTDFQNESVPIEMIEQMSTRDAGNCIERQTYGFANSKEMFVFRGCRGVFEVDGKVVQCRDGQLQRPSYRQRVKRRKWWCLWICQVDDDDEYGYYTCDIPDEINSFVNCARRGERCYIPRREVLVQYGTEGGMWFSEIIDGKNVSSIPCKEESFAEVAGLLPMTSICRYSLQTEDALLEIKDSN